MQSATTEIAKDSHKVALITGGTTGIGKETALLLASRGVQVVISGRRQETGEQLVADIKARGGEAAFIFGDVNRQDSIKEMINFTVQRYGRLNMAVNNAGVALETRRIGDSDPDLFDKMLKTNVMGLFLCMKYEIQQMISDGGGSIVNLASIAGLNGMPYSGTYAATKHAVVGLTKSGALDYATDNIRINAVAPGTTNTEIIAGAISLGQYDYPTVSAMQPMNRMGEPNEIAEGIAWLLSDAASFVTGHVLSIDGGYQAK